MTGETGLDLDEVSLISDWLGLPITGLISAAAIVPATESGDAA